MTKAGDTALQLAKTPEVRQLLQEAAARYPHCKAPVSRADTPAGVDQARGCGIHARCVLLTAALSKQKAIALRPPRVAFSGQRHQ